MPTEDLTDVALASEDTDGHDDLDLDLDAPDVMHLRWCTRGDASEVMHQR